MSHAEAHSVGGDPSRVRAAVLTDEDELLHLTRALHTENGIFSYNESKVREKLHTTLLPLDKRWGVTGVIGEPGAIEGAICLTVGSEWYSEEPCLSELFNFVYPEFRASTNSRDLIAYAKYVQTRIGIPLTIGVLSTLRTEAKVRHYRQILGDPVGAFFIHGLPDRGAH